MTSFGPQYTKIQTIWKRDEKGIVIPGEYSIPEFAYLAYNKWNWYEKVDGTNIRLHWNGEKVAVGGRTDAAQIPSILLMNLVNNGLMDSSVWKSMFPDCNDVTVCGEGFGAGIRAGGNYSQEQQFIVFDVRVGEWWLRRKDINNVAKGLNLEVVPSVGEFTLAQAWPLMGSPMLTSHWPEARIEGIVGKPLAEMFTRKGERLLAKIKVADYERFKKESGATS
jgi:hypothetical protein